MEGTENNRRYNKDHPFLVRRLPQLVIEWREEKGIKNAWISKKTGISEAKLSMILNGKARANTEEIISFQCLTGIKFLN